ncbi:hypothetical protein AYI68_g7983 [Smittium mucronatum]|uniref:Uncharacterized protein n=1 Tax=Smittium mucronatum TaxID=133383 RepID=A0A1R0GM81_9FUNG|nr:hypothetical protein AYI68_g7983 [Smittium mucronatum]
MSEADSLYQLNWYKSSLRSCCCAAKDEETLSAPLLIHSSPYPSRDLSAASMVGIIGENLNWGLGPEIIEIPSKKDTRFFITGSPAKFIYRSKSSPSAGVLEEMDTEIKLPRSSSASHQASTFGENK